MKISQTANKLILCVIALSALICGISIVFFNNLNFCGGVIFSTFFVIIKLIITEKSIAHSIELDPKSADSYMKAQYAVRYFLTGAILIVAALYEPINLYGAIVGVILAQPAGYIVMFLEGRSGKPTKPTKDTNSTNEQ